MKTLPGFVYFLVWLLVAGNHSSVSADETHDASTSPHQDATHSNDARFSAALWAKSPGQVRISEEQVVDINRDTFDDVVYLDQSTETVWAMLSDGKERLHRRAVGSFKETCPCLMRVGDVTGDSQPDIVIVSAETGKVVVGEGFSQSRLEFQNWGRLDVVGRGIDLELFRLDNDTCRDLLLISKSSDSRFLYNSLRSNCSGQFVKATASSANALPKKIMISDSNNDGRDEAYVYSQNPDQAPVGFRLAGDRRELPINPWLVQPHIVSVIPGQPPVLLAFYSSHKRRWEIHNLDNLSPLRSWAVFSSTLRWKDSVTGDVNGDGLDDLVLFSPWARDWWVALSDGTTGVVVPAAGNLPDTIWWDGLKTGDFNGDGKSDIIARDRHKGDWWIALSEVETWFLPWTKEDRPQICIGYNPGSATKWGRLQLDNYCPPQHAYYSLDDSKFPWGICCPLPATNALIDAHTIAREKCPDNYVVTGIHCIEHCDRPTTEQTPAFRCTKINTERFQLGKRKTGRYWGLGFSATYKSTIGRKGIPVAIRHAIGRRARYDWDFHDGCIGYPFGSLLVEKAVDSSDCKDSYFRELQYAGMNEVETKNTPVKMYPDCVLIDDIFSPHARCIKR